jgi:hypothetical protein
VLIFAALSLTFNAFSIPNYLCKTATGAVEIKFLQEPTLCKANIIVPPLGK